MPLHLTVRADGHSEQRSTIGRVDAGELDRFVETGDWLGLRDLIVSMSEADAAAGGTWYRRSGRALARRAAERDWRNDPRIVQLLLALTFSETPGEASRNCQWGRRFMGGDVHGGAAAACADRLVSRGREWAAEFVQLAAEAPFRGDARRGVAEVVSITSGAISAYELETPLTETYVRGWTSLISSASIFHRLENKWQWRPLAVTTGSPGEARAAYDLDENLTLIECLTGTHDVNALLMGALSVPDALLDWAAFSDEGWQVELAIRASVAAGVLDRMPLLDGAFKALSRDDRANNQRVIGELLKGLDPTPAEIRERAPLILHVLPSVHGSVTKTLLEMALTAELSADYLAELGVVILARPEKAQKNTLLAHLAKAGGDARESLLTIAAESEDASLAAKARKLLGCNGGPPPPSPTAPSIGLSPWSHPVEPFTSGRFEPYPATEAGLDQARSDEETWSRITTEAAHLDLVVRFAHRDLDRLRCVVEAAPSPNWYSHVRTPFLLHQWVATGEASRSYERISTTYRYDQTWGSPAVEHRTVVTIPPAHLHFTDRLVAETLPRLGPLTELLSTPSRWDGTLAVSALVDRVRRARDVGYGPYDLVQAMLRVGPTSPGDVALFDGMTLPPAGGAASGSRWTFGRRRDARHERDGVDIIRTWIAAGGLPPRTIDFPAEDPSSSRLSLPLPEWLRELDGIAGICSPIGTDDAPRYSWGSDDPGPWLGVCPWEVEHLAVTISGRHDPHSVFHAQKLPLIASSAGPVGPAVHHHLAKLLVHPRVDSRLLTARHAADMARQGRLRPELLHDRSVALFRHGQLSLARAAHGWTELASLSSLSVVWPAWLAVLDEACSASKKPAGLADLIRSTRDQAPVVALQWHADWMPASLRALADGRGASKAVVEARALVSAAEEAGAS